MNHADFWVTFKIAGNLVTADTVLAVGDHPHCGQPLVQTDRRIFHDGADLDGELTLRMVTWHNAKSERFGAEFYPIETATRDKRHCRSASGGSPSSQCSYRGWRRKLLLLEGSLVRLMALFSTSKSTGQNQWSSQVYYYPFRDERPFLHKIQPQLERDGKARRTQRSGSESVPAKC